MRARWLMALALLGAAPLPSRTADLVFRHVAVVDVEHALTLPDRAVVVRGDTVVATGEDARVGPRWRARRTVDGRGRYLIPGLWDMHVHFGGGPALVAENKALLPLYIISGVTTVRDCAGDLAPDAGFLNSFDYPGQALHDELALYVRYGLTPAEALAAATRAGPGWFGKLDRYGGVAAGKAADLVLLDADPLRDIAATRHIAGVALRGTYYDRTALDVMLDSVRRQVAAWDAQAAVPLHLG